MNIDLTPILQAVIGLAAMLITYRLIPWIKAKTDNEQAMKLSAAVRVAVFAAEQIYGAGRGADKLDYAFTWLTRQGYNVDKAEIEAAVKQYFNLDDMIERLLVKAAEAPKETLEPAEE